MADGTGPRRTAKRPTIGPKPFRVLTVPLQTNGEEVQGLFDSGDTPHPRAVDQLTDLAREAWLNLKGMGESGTFEFLVVPPKRTKMLPSEMWGPFAELARRSVERVLAGASPHETLPVPHAFDDWIIKFERTNNDGMSAKQALNQLRNALDKVKAQARDNADLRRESAELLEGALGELRMPPVESTSPEQPKGEPAPVDADELNVPVGDTRQPLLSAEETIERLRGLRDREAIQAFLDRFVVGRTWGGFEQNYLVATGVTEHLRTEKLRIECQDDKEPSVLRCKNISGKYPYFYFEHFTGGKQFTHGGHPEVPPLVVVAAPPDRRRRAKSEQTATELSLPRTGHPLITGFATLWDHRDTLPRGQFVEQFQDLLDQLHEQRSLGSFELNRTVAQWVNGIAKKSRITLLFNGEAVTIRCTDTGQAGYFDLRLSSGATLKGSGTTSFPRFKVFSRTNLKPS